MFKTFREGNIMDFKTMSQRIDEKSDIDHNHDTRYATPDSIEQLSGEVVTVKNKAEEALTKAQEAFQSASDGKNKIATAITGKGISADGSESYESLSSKIGSIKVAQGNAAATDVLSGKTFTNNSGTLITGTIPNRGGAVTVTPSSSNQVKSSGYYSGNITIKGDANLVAANIIKGKTIFGVAGTYEGKIVTVRGESKKVSATDLESVNHSGIPKYASTKLLNLTVKGYGSIRVKFTYAGGIETTSWVFVKCYRPSNKTVHYQSAEARCDYDGRTLSFNQDIYDVRAGDIIEVWTRTESCDVAYIRAFNIFYDQI